MSADYFLSKLLLRWNKREGLFVESPGYFPEASVQTLVQQFLQEGFTANYVPELSLIERNGIWFTAVPDWFQQEADTFQSKRENK